MPPLLKCFAIWFKLRPIFPNSATSFFQLWQVCHNLIFRCDLLLHNLFPDIFSQWKVRSFGVFRNDFIFRIGKAERYKKGDWVREIQPITNRLCEEYGLFTIEISEDRAKKSENYKEWNDFRDGEFVWADMIKRDIDAAILQSATYASFLSVLSDMGYGIKNAYRTEGKYLAIKPMGMSRFRRCRSL